MSDNPLGFLTGTEKTLQTQRPDLPTQAAAGALVWRIRRQVLEVLLVHRPRYNDWSWPKGKVEPGESTPACAAREVEEETGYPITLGLVLPTVSYRLSNGQLKQVKYWAAQSIEPTSSIVAAREPVARASILEIDRTQWMPVDEALLALTRKADRGPLEALVTGYATGRLFATQVILLRHGTSKSRDSWAKRGDGTEKNRPLTAAGLEQAETLVPLLAAWAPQEVLTSPWARCQDTVAPYIAAMGISDTKINALCETRAAAHPQQATSVMAAAIRSRTSTIICTHRPVLPTQCAAFHALANTHIAEQIPSEDPYLHPGHFLVAHIAWNANAQPLLVALERHPN